MDSALDSVTSEVHRRDLIYRGLRGDVSRRRGPGLVTVPWTTDLWTPD